jgi:hypothetical protein
MMATQKARETWIMKSQGKNQEQGDLLHFFTVANWQ